MSSTEVKPEEAIKKAEIKMPGVLADRIVGFTPEQYEQLKNFEQQKIEALAKELGNIVKTPIEQLIQKFTPKIEVAGSSTVIDPNSIPKSKNEIANEEAQKWIKGGFTGTLRLSLDKHEFLRANGYNPDRDGMIGEGWSRVYGAKTEAVTSGTQPITYNRQAIFLPGGRMRVPIRQFCNFTALSGADRAAWYTMTSFDFAAITEGTAPTEAASTITQETAVPATRGAFIKVKYSQIEDNPFPLVNALNNRALLASVDDEATEVFDTVFNAATMATGHWINGNTGANLSSDDVSGMTLTITGVATAKMRLIEEGYGTDVAPVLALHPKNYTDLLISSGIDKWVQQGLPEITRTGMLESILGVQIVQTDNVKAQDNTTNDTYRNCMFIPGETFGLASSRDLTIKGEEHSELQQLYWTATQRVKAVAYDSGGVDSAVRISCAQ